MSAPATYDRESPARGCLRVDLNDDPRPANDSAPGFDTTVPVLLFKTGRNPMHHGTLGVVRSLGRAGVPVYTVVEGAFTPAASSRYSTGHFIGNTPPGDRAQLLGDLLTVAGRIGRRAVLIPTDDLGAAFIAENAEALRPAFLFPCIDATLPGQLSNKRSLHALCRRLHVPTPELVSPASAEDAKGFASRAGFPVVVKADPLTVSGGVRSVSIVRTPDELLAIYRSVDVPAGLVCQEYIPDECAEDWIFHGYSNPRTGCFLGFTGRKLRSWPVSAGPTTLGAAISNPVLREHGIRLLKEIQYAGIVDLDYRLDKRDGQYKLLDFNPRVGANFRMFHNEAGVDVVRALHLDLTGRPVPEAPQRDGGKYLVGPQDWLATLSKLVHRELTWRDWRQSVRGPKEYAWFSIDDPVPALVVGGCLFFRLARKLLLKNGDRPD